MKNVWNVVGSHSASTRRLFLVILVAVLVGVFSTSSIASAHSVSANGKQPSIIQMQKFSTSVRLSNNTVHPHGTNGQQLALWIGSSLQYESVSMVGINQNGVPTKICAVGPNGTPIPADQWQYYGGAWWVNDVSLFYYTSAGCAGNIAYTATAHVPVSQLGDYWCFSVKGSQDPDPGICW